MLLLPSPTGSFTQVQVLIGGSAGGKEAAAVALANIVAGSKDAAVGLGAMPCILLQARPCTPARSLLLFMMSCTLPAVLSGSSTPRFRSRAAAAVQ